MRQREARGSLSPVHELLQVKKVIRGWPREWQGAAEGKPPALGPHPSPSPSSQSGQQQHLPARN